MSDPGIDHEFVATHLLRVVGKEAAAAALSPFYGGLIKDAIGLIDTLVGPRDKGAWVGRVFGLGTSQGPGRALMLANVLAQCLGEAPLAAQSGGTVMTASTGAEAATPDGEPQHLDRRIDKVLGGQAGGPAAVEAHRALGGMLDDMVGLLTSVPSGGGKNWHDYRNVTKKVEEWIGRWLKTLGELPETGTPHLRRAIAEVQAELYGPMEKRFLVALGMSVPALKYYGVEDVKDALGWPSTMKLGNEVHQVLQKEYREARARSQDLIVQESIVYQFGRSRPLLQTIEEDGSLRALYLARDRFLVATSKYVAKLGRAGQAVDRNLRSDNLNMTEGEIWEIKPIRSAAVGVVQEFVYRVFFNLYVAVIKDFPAIDALSGHGTRPLHFTREHLSAGGMTSWHELRTRPVRKINNKMVLLTQVDPLPGLVLYIRPDIPAEALDALAKYIQDCLNKWARELAKVVDELAEVLVTALVVVLVVLLGVGLIYALVKVGPALLAASGTLRVLLGANGTRIIELIRNLLPLTEPLRKSGLGMEGLPGSGDDPVRLRFTMEQKPEADAVPTTSMRVGPVRLEDVPLALAGHLEELFGAAGSLAQAIATGAMKGSTGTV